MNKIYLIIILIFITFSYGCSDKNPVDSSGENINHLIISEVHLVARDSEKNWLEIYNPTDDSLTIDAYRSSNVMCMSCLRRQVKIKPKGFIIIAADSSIISPLECDVQESQALENLDFGGYIWISTLETVQNELDIIRYGNYYWTVLERLVNNFETLEFTYDTSKSYKRILPYDAVKFKLTTPTPGY